MKKLLSKKFPLLVLILMLNTVVLSNIVWIALNQHSPYFDTSGHTILTYIFSRIFVGDYSFNGLTALLQQSNYYPPLLYFFGSIITVIFGFNYKILQVFSTLLLVPTTVLLFLYARKITKSKLIAAFSSSLFILFPVVWEQARYYMLDLPLTMWVLAAAFSLEVSNKLKKSFPTALFFVFAAFAQLTKWYGFIFLIVPFLFTYLKAYKSAGDKAKFLIEQAKLATIGAVIALPWYLVNLKQLIQDTSFFSHAHYQNPTATFSLQNFLYYPTLMLNFQIVSIMFLWLVVSLIIFIKNKTSYKKFLLTQIIFSLLVLTLLGNKNVRFTMPILPFLAIIMGYGIEKFHKISKMLSYSILGLLVGFGLLFMSVNSLGIPFKMNKMIFLAPIKNWDIFILFDGTSDIIPYYFERTQWSAQNVLDDITEKSKIESPMVYVGVNNEYLSQPIIEVFKFQDNSQVNFASPPFDKRDPLTTDKRITEYLEPFQYLLIPKESVGPEHHVNYANLDNIRKFVLSGNTRKYKWVTTYTLPTGEDVYLLEFDPDYNRLTIDVVGSDLFIKRPDSPTMLFFQVEDQNGNWQQFSLGPHQTEHYQPLPKIKTIRIDYPPELWNLYYDENWQYDLEMQIDKVN